jgi:hypothetical protein
MREQEVRELYEAYMQVHQLQEEVEQLDEDIQGAVDDATKRVQSGLEKLGLKINRTPKGTTTKKEQQDKIKQNVPLNNSFDLFDTILEHLVAEGYADTNEAALAIMANMSEEWRESIVETVWYGKSGFNPPVAQQRRLGPEVGASGGFSVLAKKGGVEGMKQLMPPGQGKDKWHPGKWTPEGRKRHDDQKNKSPNLLGRIVNTVYKDK